MEKKPLPENKIDRQDEQTYAIIGAAMEVHRELGHGFLEIVYQEALAVELEEQLIPFKREVPLPVVYKFKSLPCSYKADFICFDDILLEIKAIETLTSAHFAQVLNYLRATALSRALLINFGAPNIQCRRIVFSKNKQSSVKYMDKVDEKIIPPQK